MSAWLARGLLGLLWLLHLLPLAWLAVLGRALGAALHALGGMRRRVALRNVALCLPELDDAAQRALVRAHFGWVGRSLLERGLLLYASPERLRRLIHVEGDVRLSETSPRPVMWLVPHFLAMDVAGASTQLFQARVGASIYTAQSNPVFDAALRRARTRFGLALVFSRTQGALPLVRAVKRGAAFFNLPDMDFGLRDAAFVPFFGHPAATLLAPSRMARSLHMVVQPVVCEILPGGRGWRVQFGEPWTDWPSDDPVDDAARMNRWVEAEIRRCPAQYLWVHKRFKTRPDGQAPIY